MTRLRTYIVTGATGTIGKAITDRLRADGAHVIGTYCHQNKFEVESGLSLRHLDLSRSVSIRKFAATVENEFGMVDGLVNCAGVNVPKPFDEVTEEDLDTVLDINLRGTFLLTQAILLLIKGHGAIVNIGSVSGRLGGPTSVHYAMSKGALEAFTVGVAKFATKWNIRCNLIVPGFISSPMASKATSPTVQKVIDSIPLGEGEPDEVANVVAFMLSDQASYMTGTTIDVTGGL